MLSSALIPAVIFHKWMRLCTAAMSAAKHILRPILRCPDHQELTDLLQYSRNFTQLSRSQWDHRDWTFGQHPLPPHWCCEAKTCAPCLCSPNRHWGGVSTLIVACSIRRLSAEVSGPDHSVVHWEVSAKLPHWPFPLEFVRYIAFVLACRIGTVSMCLNIEFLGLIQLVGA